MEELLKQILANQKKILKKLELIENINLAAVKEVQKELQDME